MININSSIPIIGIYKITSPSSKVYIGQSINILKRWKYNYYNLLCKQQHKLYNSLKKYGYDKHQFEVIEECNKNQLLEKEIYWKQYYLEQQGWDKVLFCELYDRGGGPRSENTKLKISKGLKGKINSEETKKKKSESNKGKIRTKIHSYNISQSNKGKSKPEGFGEKISKPIFQYDLQGNFIKEWPSLKEACMFYQTTSGNLSQNINGKTKSAKGFKWKLG